MDYKKILYLIFAFIFLLGSYFLVFYQFLSLTEILFVPWDTVQTQLRPESGTWERVLNDFFESGIGAMLFSILFVCFSLFALFLKFKKEKLNYKTLYFFGILNLTFLFFTILILFLSDFLNKFLFESGVVGYEKSIIPILFLIILLFFIFKLKFNNKKNQLS